LAHTAQLAKLTEDASDGFLNLTIWSLLHALVFSADITDGNLGQHQAATYFLAARLHRTLSEQTDLELAHRPFEAEQKPVVKQTGIIDAVVIDDQRIGHGAKVDQVVPVSVVSGQARSFER
jgi:hypothetical protein